MTNEIIIKRWRSGLTAMQVAEEYMESYNKKAKQNKEPKINKKQAAAFVYPIIYEFETKDWRKK